MLTVWWHVFMLLLGCKATFSDISKVNPEHYKHAGQGRFAPGDSHLERMSPHRAGEMASSLSKEFAA